MTQNLEDRVAAIEQHLKLGVDLSRISDTGLYRPNEAAQLTGFHRSTIDRMVKRGRLHKTASGRIPGRMLIALVRGEL